MARAHRNGVRRRPWRPGPDPGQWLDELRREHAEDPEVTRAITALLRAGLDPISLGWQLGVFAAARDGRKGREWGRRLVRDMHSVEARIESLSLTEICFSDVEGNDRALLIDSLKRFAATLSDGRIDGRGHPWTNAAMERLDTAIRERGGRPYEQEVKALVNAVLGRSPDDRPVTPRRRACRTAEHEH